MQKTKPRKRMTYAQQRERLSDFLNNFEEYGMEVEHGAEYNKYGHKKYLIQMQMVANEKAEAVEVAMEDMESYLRREEELEMLQNIRTNTLRYIEMLTALVDELLPPRNIEINPEEMIQHKLSKILEEQRKQNAFVGELQHSDNEKIPTAVHKNYDVRIIFGKGSKIHPLAISELNSQNIGSLVALKAMVVRTGEVQPLLAVATYACDLCGCQNYQQIFSTSYKPLVTCVSRKCKENKVAGKLTFLANHSKFKPYQKLKIQETPDQLVNGRVPRVFWIELRGNLIRLAVPGDVIMVQGVLLPERRIGARQADDLMFDLYLQAMKVTREKKRYVEMGINQTTTDMIAKVRSSMPQEELFKRLAQSLAPEIYGITNVKKALLLQLAGGVTKETHDNLYIRGEINIALIGDPGVAKSQLLKHISYIAPRGIYTTGKGSSGVGLTAAIVIDPTSREVTLEAGALVLADMGICCIDEFDKMDQYDRTAIHEVMEQQTVSIAKAGIVTTLNARTSILAAANPLYGRYNDKQSAHRNINLPAALLSRFDLIFILKDIANQERDRQLAQHIGHVHQKLQSPLKEFFNPEFLRCYIALSKSFNPVMSDEIQKELIERYLNKRQLNASDIKECDSYVTPRSLLGLIRFCQARARLRFSNEVSREDILECEELILSAQQDIGSKRDKRSLKRDNVTEIFTIIKDSLEYREGTEGVDLQDIRRRVMSKGFSSDQFDITVKNYENMDVLLLYNGRLTLVNS